MAFTFNTSISESVFNNSYNNSIVEFQSTLLGSPPNKCEITISGFQFDITPIGLIFRFNFKEIITVLINQNQFDDGITQPSDVVIDNNLKLEETVIFTIIFDDLSTDVTNKTYTFLKSVQQIANENLITLTVPQILSLEYLTVFRGYPFDLTYSSVDTLTIFNNTINTSIDLNTISGNINRIFLSDGQSIMDNITNATLFFDRMLLLPGVVIYDNQCSNIMLEPILRTGTNNLTFLSDGDINNINIKMIDNNCGVYLKWANPEGNFSYWLFSKVFQETISSNAINVYNTDFENLSSTNTTALTTGKESGITIKLNYKNLSEKEVIQVTSLLTAPRVWLYNGEKNDKLFDSSWQTVIVKNGQFLVTNTKKNTQNISLEIVKNNYTQF